MTTRPAKFADIVRITDLLIELHPRTIYAGRCQVSREVTLRTLRQAIDKNGFSHDGAALVLVEEDAAGTVQGFIVGALSRIYLIMDKLQADDIFLHVTDAAPKGAMQRLVAGYTAWADANPNVLDVNLSWSDATPDGERIEPFYRRLGFHRSGGKLTRARRALEMGAIAA